MKRTLRLRREVLTELSDADLAGVAGATPIFDTFTGSQLYSLCFLTCVTWCVTWLPCWHEGP